MASNNQLLGSGTKIKKDKKKDTNSLNKTEDLFSLPRWIYNLEFPKGKIIYTEKEFKALNGNFVSNIKHLSRLSVTQKPKNYVAPAKLSKIDFSEKD